MLSGYAISGSQQYAVWSSDETIPVALVQWESYIPATSAQFPYVWTRTVLELGGGNSYSYSTPVCLSGIQGEPGPEGRSVEEIFTYYQLSQTQPPEPQEEDIPPLPPAGWTDQAITFTDQNYIYDLWCVNLVKYNDGSYAYSPVHLDNAYQAAKSAWSRANNALVSANGKNKVYYLSSQSSPQSPSEGDLWFQTDLGNKMMVYSNGAWAAAPYGVDALSNTLNMENINVSGLNAGAIATGNLRGIHIIGNTISVGDVPSGYDPETYDSGSTADR